MAGGVSRTRTADITSTIRLITRHFCNIIIRPPLAMLHEDHCRKPQHDMLKDYGSKEPTVGIETMSRRKRYISRVVLRPAFFFFENGRCMFCPGSGTKRAQAKTQPKPCRRPLTILISTK